jgi:glycerol-3-phosphate dehydrogenase (NAD(P)+)
VNIAVIGAGGWGTALALVLGQKGHAVRLWAFEPDLAARLHATRETTESSSPVRSTRRRWLDNLVRASGRDGVLVEVVPRSV